LPVCSSELTTDVPCLLVAWTTAMIGLPASIAPLVLDDDEESPSYVHRRLVSNNGHFDHGAKFA
jgi:hypothetical protein